LSERIYTLDVIDPQQFYGPNNLHLTIIKSKFPKLQFVARGDEIKIFGDEASMDAFQTAMKHLEKVFLKSKEINEHIVLEALEGIEVVKPENTGGPPLIGTGDVLLIGTRGQQIKARTRNQVKMVNAARTNDIVFAIGPEGTGKTYTAVAIAVLALKEREIRRIILTRPAVEAGENLGFLPGDLMAKIDPYLRPLYDALYDMMDPEAAVKLIERQTIEVAPLAFMRGRTLNNSFVILDEAQNTTPEQMKMFLTRIGFGSKVVVTGDTTQVDVPDGRSGLLGVERVLTGIKDLTFVHLDATDVVRHRIVADIVAAYEKQTPNHG
jgi:phosphate starvation-inducible PhoH-like protein